MPGNRFAGIAAGAAAIQQGKDPLRLLPATADFKERSHDRPNHIPQKAVGADTEEKIVSFRSRKAHQTDMGRGVRFPAGLRQRADG